METAIRTDVMLHAFMLFLSGIPMIYSGDEIGQVNDYSYHDDPLKAADSRYIHRGSFQWDLVGRIDLPGTVQNGIFHGLRKLEMIRAQQTAFDASASFGTLDTGDDAVLGLVRESGGERIIGVFNFSGQQRNIRVSGEEGSYEDLMDGAIRELPQAELEAYEFCWLKRLEPLL